MSTVDFIGKYFTTAQEIEVVDYYGNVVFRGKPLNFLNNKIKTRPVRHTSVIMLRAIEDVLVVYTSRSVDKK